MHRFTTKNNGSIFHDGDYSGPVHFRGKVTAEDLEEFIATKYGMELETAIENSESLPPRALAIYKAIKG